MAAFTPGGCAGIKQKPAYLLLSRGLAPSSPLSFCQSFHRFFLHPSIESSDQTKAVKLEPLVYRVEEIAQLLAISPRAAYNLCNTTKDFRVLRIGTSIRVNKQSFDNWFAAV